MNSSAPSQLVEFSQHLTLSVVGLDFILAHIKSLVLPLLISICFAATILTAQDQIQLDCKELQESSGVAVSLNDPALIWSHNDSGGKPKLYLFSRTSGKRR